MASSRRLLGLALALCFAGPLVAMPDAARQALDRARAVAAAGDGIAAEAEARKALAAGASRTDVAAVMGQALLLQDADVRAREWLTPGAFATADAALGWRMNGRLLQRSGRLPEAGRAFDKAYALNPNDPQLWVDIAGLRYQGGEHSSALEAGKRALQLGPDHSRALALAAQFARDAGGPAAALPLIDRGLEATPNDRGLQADRAALLGEAGRSVEMLALTRAMIASDPRDPFPFLLQAVLAARAGRIDLAKALLARTKGRFDAVPSANLLASAIELEAGNTATALSLLEQLDRQQPANPRIGALYARALYQAGEDTRLRQRFAASAARPDAPAYLLTLLGRSFERTGDRAAAATFLDRAAQVVGAPPPKLSPTANPGAGNLPQSFGTIVAGADQALLAGRALDAVPIYDNAASIRQPGWLLQRRVAALTAAGDTAAAARLVDRMRASTPNSLAALRLAAEQAAARQNWTAALALLDLLDRRTGHGDVRVKALKANARRQLTLSLIEQAAKAPAALPPRQAA